MTRRKQYNALNPHPVIQRTKLPQAYLARALQIIVQGLMEMDVTAVIEASRYERRGTRRAYRNGYRESLWRSAHGHILIRIPKLRSGSYFPQFLEDSTIQSALTTLASTALLEVISIDDVRKLAEHIGIRYVSEYGADIQLELHELTELQNERLINSKRVYLKRLVIGDEVLFVAEDDHHELIAYEQAPSDDQQFWQDFIRRIDRRALHGVEYISIGQERHIVRLSQSTSFNAMLMVA